MGFLLVDELLADYPHCAHDRQHYVRDEAEKEIPHQEQDDVFNKYHIPKVRQPGDRKLNVFIKSVRAGDTAANGIKPACGQITFGDYRGIVLPLQRTRIQWKGTKSFPSCFPGGLRPCLFERYMDKETQLEEIRRMVTSLISDNPSVFLVEVKIKPTNNVKVFLDGDSGITIKQCAEYNRALYKLLEERSFYPDGDFSLEVSSAGLDEPFKSERQYIKNIGREVEVTTVEGKMLEGKMVSADSHAISIEEEKGKNKKKEIVVHTIPVEHIKSTKIHIKF